MNIRGSRRYSADMALRFRGMTIWRRSRLTLPLHLRCRLEWRLLCIISFTFLMLQDVTTGSWVC
jgi:hypothetical protein